MKERDVPLGELPSMVSADTARVSSLQGSPKAHAKRGKEAANSGAESPRLRMGLIILTVLIVMLGVVQYQISRMNTDWHERFNESQQSVGNLQSELASTGETINESGDAITAKLKFFENEIRKLWDVANKRNRASINALEKKLSTVSGAEKSLKGALTGLEKQQKLIRSDLKGAVTGMSVMADDVRLLEGQLDRQQVAIKEVSASMDMAALNQSLSSISKRIAALEAESEQTRESLQAVDKQRAQLNRELTQLKSSIQQTSAAAL